jgi:hypothetical protein
MASSGASEQFCGLVGGWSESAHAGWCDDEGCCVDVGAAVSVYERWAVASEASVDGGHPSPYPGLGSGCHLDDDAAGGSLDDLDRSGVDESNGCWVVVVGSAPIVNGTYFGEAPPLGRPRPALIRDVFMIRGV